MKRYQQYIISLLIIGLCFFSCASNGQWIAEQGRLDKLVDNFIDSLNRINPKDTIIEIRTCKPYTEYDTGRYNRLPYYWDYVYFKEYDDFRNHDYCGIRFDSTGAWKDKHRSMGIVCSNLKYQILFDFIADYWDSLKTEKVLPRKRLAIWELTDKVKPPRWSFDRSLLDISICCGGKRERVTINKVDFLPENENYKINILTKTFLLLTLIEKYDAEIEMENMKREEVNMRNSR